MPAWSFPGRRHFIDGDGPYPILHDPDDPAPRLADHLPTGLPTGFGPGGLDPGARRRPEAQLARPPRARVDLPVESRWCLTCCRAPGESSQGLLLDPRVVVLERPRCVARPGDGYDLVVFAPVSHSARWPLSLQPPEYYALTWRAVRRYARLGPEGSGPHPLASIRRANPRAWATLLLALEKQGLPDPVPTAGLPTCARHPAWPPPVHTGRAGARPAVSPGPSGFDPIWLPDLEPSGGSAQSAAERRLPSAVHRLAAPRQTLALRIQPRSPTDNRPYLPLLRWRQTPQVMAAPNQWLPFAAAATGAAGPAPAGDGAGERWPWCRPAWRATPPPRRWLIYFGCLGPATCGGDPAHPEVDAVGPPGAGAGSGHSPC
jgi:hypothetical protein